MPLNDAQKGGQQILALGELRAEKAPLRPAVQLFPALVRLVDG